MILFVAAGIIIGIVVGLNANFGYNTAYSVYIALAILSIINTLFNVCVGEGKEMGALRCIMYFCSDILFAMFFVFIGEQLGMPLYLAAVFAFGNNIYGKIKDAMHSFIDKKNI